MLNVASPPALDPDAEAPGSGNLISIPTGSIFCTRLPGRAGPGRGARASGHARSLSLCSSVQNDACEYRAQDSRNNSHFYYHLLSTSESLYLVGTVRPLQYQTLLQFCKVKILLLPLYGGGK